MGFFKKQFSAYLMFRYLLKYQYCNDQLFFMEMPAETSSYKYF